MKPCGKKGKDGEKRNMGLPAKVRKETGIGLCGKKWKVAHKAFAAATDANCFLSHVVFVFFLISSLFAFNYITPKKKK